jgi:hypothetical protein
MNSDNSAVASAQTKRRWLTIGASVLAILTLAACSGQSEAAGVAAKYSEQTARAIIEGSGQIAGAIFGAAIIRAICNK